MSQQQRNILKLKMPAGSKAEEPVQTPASITPKLKLKFGGGHKQSTLNAEDKPAIPLEAPRRSIIKLSNPDAKNETLRTTAGKKRKNASIGGIEVVPSAASAKAKTGKSLKLIHKPSITPKLKVKMAGRPPVRPKGVGYDSEASDTEKDPHIEENFILRMIPGEDCEYVRQAIQDRNWGQHGARVQLKFLQADGRRAVLSVEDRLYAATFVDMPCIVEGVKSWDKKAWYKVADICQMLIVLGRVQSDGEALTYPLPEREVDPKTWAFAHGLTPPMRWVRKRRFRKRTSTHTIEEVEAQVQRLLQADAEAVGETRFAVIDPHRTSAQNVQVEPDQSDEDMDDEVDGDGEVDGEEDGMEYETETAGGMEDEDANADDLEAQFESFMAQGDDEGTMEVDAEVVATPVSSGPMILEAQPVESSEAETPAAGTVSKDETEDEESDEDDEEEVDDDEMELRADIQRQRDEIADLSSAIKDQMVELNRVQSNMLKNKIQNKIQSLRAEVELKRVAIGEGEED